MVDHSLSRWARRAGAGAVAVIALALAGAALWRATGVPAPDDRLRLLRARHIRTMDPERPVVEAVAIQSGRIVALGPFDRLVDELGDRIDEIDESFRDHVLLPGFIDPHIHPVLAASILPMEIVSAMSWTTPRGRTEPVVGQDAFAARLRALDAELSEAGDADGWLMVWGYHAPYHGALSRRELDAVSTKRPIFVWQRSVHEMFFNTRALEELEMVRADWDAHPQADWEDGHLFEAGTLELGQPMTAVLASPGRYLGGLSMMSEVLHRGGLTTVGEQGHPQVDALLEYATLAWEMHGDETPYRFVLVPNAAFLMRREGSAAAAVEAAEALLTRGNDQIETIRHAKYYADGAIFSQLMQMSEPYIDGHHGEWMMPPEDQSALFDAFWRAGWNIHIHVNGDAGLDVVLDHIEAARQTHPRPDGRIVLEHYGYAREDQHDRVKALGVEVSNNAYYVHELAPIYAEFGLGPERARDISPLGGLVRAGVPFSFHSDFPMAPAQPLTLVWAAVNRIGSDGQVWGEDQRVDLDLALRAVTLEAARSLGLQDEIGSVAVGKRADFTVLDQDPAEVAPQAIKDIGVWGVVLGGRAFPVRPANGE